MYIPNPLRTELEAKRNYLRDPDTLASSKLPLRKQVKSYQVSDALVHTARGELPVAEAHYIPNFKKSERFKKILEGIQNAWRFGILTYEPQEMNETFLRHLTWELDPEFFQGNDAYFRRPSPVFTVETSWGHIPPDATKVRDELHQHFFDNPRLEEMTIPERAIYHNLHIARIQPFPDCNKRTGKILQNVILYRGEYPPATIREGEVGYYNRLLGRAVRGYKERQGKGKPSTGEQRFFEFMGTKININLDFILDEGLSISPEIKRI